MPNLCPIRKDFLLSKTQSLKHLLKSNQQMKIPKSETKNYNLKSKISKLHNKLNHNKKIPKSVSPIYKRTPTLPRNKFNKKSSPKINNSKNQKILSPQKEKIMQQTKKSNQSNRKRHQ